jgi:hypothetical protein
MDDVPMTNVDAGMPPPQQGATGTIPGPTPVVAQLTQQQLFQLVQYATQIPMQTMQNLHMSQTQQFVQLQQQQLEMQRQVFERLANPPAADPLKKLLESDPQFPVFSGQSQDLLRWVLECQDKINQRNMSHRVAITFAKIALGNSIRGLIRDDQEFADWPAFVQFLKSKWLQSTADWALYKETDQWRMNGNWPHYHSVVHTYKMFLPANLHQGLLINMIAGLDPYMRHKMCKEPKPSTLDEALTRGWTIFQQSPSMPTGPFSYGHPPATTAGQYSQAPPVHTGPPNAAMDLDTMRTKWQHPSNPTFYALSETLNPFSGAAKPTFGRQSRSPRRSDPNFSAMTPTTGARPRTPSQSSQLSTRSQSPNRGPSNSENRRFNSRPDTRDRERSHQEAERSRRYAPRPEYSGRRPRSGTPQAQNRTRSTSRETTSSRRDQDGCYLCGKADHWARNCPTRSSHPAQQSAKFPRPTSPRTSGNPTGR